MGMPKGTKLSKDTRAKMSKARVGDKNPNWKGGLTIKKVGTEIKVRDDYTCRSCGLEVPEIAMVDHVKPRYLRPDLYLHKGNLQTLCPNCHARKTTKDRKEIAKYKRLRNYVKQVRYQNSECRNGWLHDFRQVKETRVGFLERCTRCGLQIHFPANVPNHIYLSYHIRSALRPSDPLFLREYPNALK